MAAPATPHSRINLTQWTTARELARIVIILSLPVAATNALQTLLGFVDTRMVSTLGPAALPALGVGRTGMFFFSSVFMGLGVGITAYVARLTGAGEHERAKQYATTGVVVGGLLGVLMMVIGLLWAEGPVKGMVTSQAGGVDTALQTLTQKYAWDFMRIMFISLGGVGIQFAAISVFNSLGRTVVPMWLLVFTNVANFIGNVLLIPRYEVAGSATATLITSVLAGILATWWLQRNGTISIDLARLFNPATLVAPLRRGWEMFMVGLPVTIQVMARSMSMLILLKLITYLPDSVAGQGALQVGLQVESLAFMPAFAFSTAVATLVGQNLGAGKPDQARQATWYCLIGSQIVMWVIGSVQIIWPEFFIHLFIGDNAPEVVAPAAQYIRILGLCLPGLGLSLTMMGALRGSGDTAITAWISIGSMYLVRMPLAFLLSQHNLYGTNLGLGWGLSGLWWAMTVSVYVEAIFAWLRFRSGKWAEVKLRSPAQPDSEVDTPEEIKRRERRIPSEVVIVTDPIPSEPVSGQPVAFPDIADERLQK